MNNTNGSRSTTKHPTIQDVAGALGLHKSTVSVAFSGKGNLSEATRNRVLSMARDLGYEPNPLAQRLANGVSNSLVCLFSGVLDVGLGTEKILRIQKELARHGLEVPIYTSSDQLGNRDESQATQIKQLCRQRPRAIVCAAQTISGTAFEELEAYQRTGGIVVSYDTRVPLDCDQVVFDREDNAYRAARHLLELGHRRVEIAMSGVGAVDKLAGPHAIRMKGFLRALREFDVAIPRHGFFVDKTYEKGGAAMARHFLQLQKRPTGVCIVNDYVALAFMSEIMRAGIRVPQEVSIIGHDDQPIARYCPVPLTAVSQPVEKIAQAVVELLMERLNGSNNASRTVTVRGELVQRQSVTAPMH